MLEGLRKLTANERSRMFLRARLGAASRRDVVYGGQTDIFERVFTSRSLEYACIVTIYYYAEHCQPKASLSRLPHREFLANYLAARRALFLPFSFV